MMRVLVVEDMCVRRHHHLKVQLGIQVTVDAAEDAGLITTLMNTFRNIAIVDLGSAG